MKLKNWALGLFITIIQLMLIGLMSKLFESTFDMYLFSIAMLALWEINSYSMEYSSRIEKLESILKDTIKSKSGDRLYKYWDDFKDKE